MYLVCLISIKIFGSFQMKNEKSSTYIEDNWIEFIIIFFRRNELRRLQIEANNRDTLETNRFLGLTIIEVMAKNWWFQYEPRQIAYINNPDNRFSDVKKEELAED